MTNKRKVFVVHGRNNAARDGMFAFLRALGLQPVEWEHAIKITGEGSPYIGTVLDHAFSAAQAIVVLLTPDEITYLRSEYAHSEDDLETQPAAQARPNVLFEAGMALGRNTKRTILVELGKVREFSDVSGRHAIRLSNDSEKRTALAERLRTAGCEVDTSGTDWLSAGDLTPPLPPGGSLPLGKRVPGSPAQQKVRLDAQFINKGRGTHRIQLINRGSIPVYDVNLELPPEIQNMQIHSDELPLTKLPAGKSASFMVSRWMGAAGKDHFDLHVTGRTDEGTPVEEDIFISVGS
jgi:hypothetical protein